MVRVDVGRRRSRSCGFGPTKNALLLVIAVPVRLEQRMQHLPPVLVLKVSCSVSQMSQKRLGT